MRAYNIISLCLSIQNSDHIIDVLAYKKIVRINKIHQCLSVIRASEGAAKDLGVSRTD